MDQIQQQVKEYLDNLNFQFNIREEDMFSNNTITRAYMHINLEETSKESFDSRLLNLLNKEGLGFSRFFERRSAQAKKPEASHPVTRKNVEGLQLRVAVMVLDERDCCP